ncbi:hypothetical protein [Candidatus Rhodoblastus alkanivorans]|uniref:hypothetical protein n=1 Tax=Candidatus Rhodoblastus alkanivorans TaxID=2954117 RepID=UPI0030144636
MNAAIGRGKKIFGRPIGFRFEVFRSQKDAERFANVIVIVDNMDDQIVGGSISLIHSGVRCSARMKAGARAVAG